MTITLLALLAVTGLPQGPAADPLPVLLYWQRPYSLEREAETWGLLRSMRDHLAGNHARFRRPTIYMQPFGDERSAHWFAPYGRLGERFDFELVVAKDGDFQSLVQQADTSFDEDRPEWSTYLLPLGGAPLGGGLRPFRELRIAHAVPSKSTAARRHTLDVALYLEATYPEVDAAAYASDLDEQRALFLLVDHYDLSSWESVRARLIADDDFLELQRQGEGLYLEEGVVETMLAEIEFDWSSAAAHYNQAKALGELGDLVGAAACYRRALEIDPDMAQALHFLGHTLEELGDPAGAIDCYRRWIAVVPTFPMAHRDLAWVLATSPREELRDPDQALQLAERTIELDEAVNLLWLTLGVCRYRTGDFEGSVEALERSIELDGSGDPYDWLFLAMAQHRLGNEDEAHRWFARSIDWVAENGPDPAYTRYPLRRNGELAEFLAEAREVLGVDTGEERSQ